MGSSPLATASRMCEILGNFPQEWMGFPFEDGYPVYEPLQQGVENTTLGDFTERNGYILDTEVGLICKPQRSLSTRETLDGREWLCLPVPTIWDTAARAALRARNIKPIGKEDAALSLLQDIQLQLQEPHHGKTSSGAPLAKGSMPETLQCRSNRVIGSKPALPAQPSPQWRLPPSSHFPFSSYQHYAQVNFNDCNSKEQGSKGAGTGAEVFKG